MAPKTTVELQMPTTGNFTNEDILILIDASFDPKTLDPNDATIHLLAHTGTWTVMPYKGSEKMALITNQWESAIALVPELVNYLNMDPNAETPFPPFPFVVIGSISDPNNPKHWIIQKQDQGSIDLRKNKLKPEDIFGA